MIRLPLVNVTEAMVYDRLENYEALRTKATGAFNSIENIGTGSDGTLLLKGMIIGDVVNKPVILLIGNVHGSEYLAAHYVVEFCRLIRTRVLPKKLANFILSNVGIYAILSGNPWGYEQTTYLNYNSVNINRNYDYNWEAWPETFDNNYKGTAPFSEVETKIIRDKVTAYAPIMVVDCHTTSPTSGIDTGYKLYKQLTTNAMKSIGLVTGETQMEWNTSGNPTSVGWVSTQTGVNGRRTIPTLVESTTSNGAEAAMSYGINSLLNLVVHAILYYQKMSMNPNSL